MVMDELSRLGRSMVEMLVEVNALLERDIAIKTLDGRLDTTSMPQELVKLIVELWGMQRNGVEASEERTSEEDP